MDDSFATGYAVGADRSSGDGLFGNSGSWIWVILIIAIFFGGFNGRGLFGGNGGQGTSYDGYVLTSDFSQVERKLDTVNAGLCDGFYTQAQLIAGVNQNIAAGFAAQNTAMVQNGYETRIAVNGIGQQLSNCCCDIREGISGVNYNIAQQTNALQKQISDCCCENRAAIAQVRYDMSQNTRDIVDNANANTRAILDYLCQDKIQTLQAENSALRLKASQEAQNNYLVNALRPNPTPAYVVPNPFCCNTSTGNSCGCGYNA